MFVCICYTMYWILAQPWFMVLTIYPFKVGGPTLSGKWLNVVVIPSCLTPDEGILTEMHWVLALLTFNKRYLQRLDWSHCLLHPHNVSACVRAPQGPPTLAVDVISSTCVDHEKIEMHLLKSLVVWPRPYLHVARPDATVIIPFRARSWNQGGLAASDMHLNMEINILHLKTSCWRGDDEMKT